MAERRPGYEEERAGGKDDYYRRAHVRLDDDQPADHADHEDKGREAQAELVDILAATGQPGRDVDDDGQLGKLAGLEGDRAELQPAPGPVTLHADAGDQHGQQTQERYHHYRRRHVAQLPVVQAHEVDQRRQSHEGVDRLTRYEVRGAAEIHIAHSEAGRVYGEQAGHEEHGCCHKQEVVRRARPQAAAL